MNREPSPTYTKRTASCASPATLKRIFLPESTFAVASALPPKLLNLPDP